MHRLDEQIALELDKSIEQKSEYLHEVALTLVGIFYEERKNYKRRQPRNKRYLPSHYGCRVRKNAGPGISIEWFRNNYYTCNGKKKSFSTYIKLPKSGIYHEKKVFNWQARDWEIHAFRFLEPNFAELRKQSLALGKLSQSVKFYLRSVGLFDEDLYFDIINNYYTCDDMYYYFKQYNSSLGIQNCR